MKRGFLQPLFLAMLCLQLFDSTGYGQQPAPVELFPIDTSSLQTFFETHCYECHDEDSEKGNLNLFDLDTNLADAETMRRWVLIHDRIASGEMPPEKKERPTTSEQTSTLGFLSKVLNQADAARNEVVLRRLNRIEYENTVCDLFGIKLPLAGMLPEDAKSHGFDTIGEALSISVEQMQIYLEAADLAVSAVLGDEEAPNRIEKQIDFVKELEGNTGPEKLFLNTGEGVAMFHGGYNPSQIRSFRAPAAGTYRVRIRARAFQSETPVMMKVYGGDVVGNRREKHLVGYWDIAPGKEWTLVEFSDRIEMSDTFFPAPYGVPNYLQIKDRFKGRGLEVKDATIEGPLEEWPPPSRARLLGKVDPDKGTIQDIKQIVERLLPFAFRRPVEPGESTPFVGLAREALADDREWIEALRFALKGILCSPDFLFLDEPGREEISQYALANRLSYFFWSTMPDPELLSLAHREELAAPEVLRKQVERMLKDERSRQFVENFTGQWLGLREIDFTEPDKRLYPDFDELLKVSMLEETRLFFRRMFEENLPVEQFIESDWTYLNQRLALHYGIEGVKGNEFEKVSLPEESVRGGVLTQGSLLKVTANGTNTSPVLRGVWFLENFYGAPTPPPPPSVPGVEPDIRGTTTIREQLEKHRELESCASCHAKIDPPGFALEEFDVIGRHRDYYRSLGEGEHLKILKLYETDRNVQYRKGLPVDSSGTMPGGTDFSGVKEFKQLLLKERKQVAKCLTGKLFTYALGRGMGFSDRAAIEEVVAANGGFRDLIHRVVQSPVFREP